MLPELSVVEQRCLAVREVLDGARVTDVATRYGVDRRTVDVVGLSSSSVMRGYVEFVTGGTRFGLLERTRASDLIHREPTEGGPAGEVLFLVDDVDAEAERPRGLGVELLSGPVDRRWGTGPSTSSIPTGSWSSWPKRSAGSRLAMADVDNRAVTMLGARTCELRGQSNGMTSGAVPEAQSASGETK